MNCASEQDEFDIDEAWAAFSTDTDNGHQVLASAISVTDASSVASGLCPEPSELKISTKTKIAYMEPIIGIYDLFWKIPIIDYHLQMPGVVKKEMKCSSDTKEELDEMFRLCENEKFVRFHVVKHIDKTTGNVHFKDVRKIISGISKHDVLHKRVKQKSAFFNCVVVNIRLDIDGVFKEYHIKLFNSGKIEMPGTHEPGINERVVGYISKLIENATGKESKVLNHSHTALVNSNFTLNFELDRDKLMDRLHKGKYDIISSFDPCSYPGVRNVIKFKNICAAYPELNDLIVDGVRDGTMSCMIFRTGSVLLIGKCCDIMLQYLYKYVCDILRTEYNAIVAR
jgi:hypothetical protein